MSKPLKTQVKKSVAPQIASLGRGLAAGARSTPTPPCLPRTPRHPHPRGGTPPGQIGIPLSATPFRETGARAGFGLNREFGRATTGVGGVCHGA